MKTIYLQKVISAIFVMFLLNMFQPAAAQQSEIDKYLTDLPFAKPEISIPIFPDYKVNITDFGAKGDGLFKNTQAFADAIKAVSAKGGGTVIVPAGIWYTGPIEFQSNINLYLEKGSLIIFSRDHKDYAIIKVPKSKRYIVANPIYGFNLENIAVTGDGILDGSGETWRPVKKTKMNESQWKKLIASGGVVSADGSMYWPTKEAMEGEEYVKSLSKKQDATEIDYEPARDFLRPNMVVFYRCKKVLFDGNTYINSPKFTINPQFCENMVIRNVKVLNDWWMQNADGIDLSSCRDVLMYHCEVNTGDDAICMKSSPQSGITGASLKNIVISDCVVYRGHGGFVIGSNTDGGMRNISVTNCTFIGTDIGLRFKSRRGSGGLVDSVFISNIYMKDIINEAILFDTYYESSSGENDTSRQEVNEKTPVFEKFFIENVFCNRAEQAIKLYGLPEMPIRDITMKNIIITSDKGFISKDAFQIKLTDITVAPSDGLVFAIKNSSQFALKNIHFIQPIDLFMKVSGKQSQNITIEGTDFSKVKKQFEFNDGADKKAIQVK